MATLSCQGLQSCLESQFMEQPVTLELKLASPTPPNPQTQHSSSSSSSSSSSPLCFEVSTKTTQPQEFETTQTCPSSEFTKKPMMSPEPGGWSFLQTNDHYAYPKRAIFKDDFCAPSSTTNSIPSTCSRSCSSLVLSGKSLELCTENLGNETGTEITENSMFLTMGCEVTNLPSKGQTETTSTQHFGAKKKHVARSFPPPLTTITGTESMQVRSYREDGRLVIEAIKTPSIQAERSHGRLRLCLLRECPDEEEIQSEKEEEEEEEEVEESDDMDNGGEEFEVEEEVDGKNENAGDKMGIEMFKRTERCKGVENRTLLDWNPFWVATYVFF